jgi:hypothetical protein
MSFKNKYLKYKKKYLKLKKQIGGTWDENCKKFKDTDIPDENCLNEIYHNIGCKRYILLQDKYFNENNKEWNTTNNVIIKNSNNLDKKKLIEDGFSENEIKEIYKYYNPDDDENLSFYLQTLYFLHYKELKNTLDKLKNKYFEEIDYYKDNIDKYLGCITYVDKYDGNIYIRKKDFKLTKKEFIDRVQKMYNDDKCHLKKLSDREIKSYRKYGDLYTDKEAQDDDEKSKKMYEEMSRKITVTQDNLVKDRLSFLDFLMTPDIMKKNIINYLIELRKRGMLLKKSEFDDYKKHFISWPWTNFSRLLGANYINKRFKDYDHIKAAKHYLVLKDDNNLTFQIDGTLYPYISPLKNSFITIKLIKGDTNYGYKNEDEESNYKKLYDKNDYEKGYVRPENVDKVEGNLLSIGFRDFGKRNNDPQKYRNVKEENGKFFVVDTESKGFKETNLANKYNKVAYIKFNKKYELPLEIKIENKDLQDILNLAEMNEENVLKEYSDI